MTDSAREAFCTPRGIWRYKVSPLGMRNPDVTRTLEKTEAYVDDVATSADIWHEHFKLIRNLFIQVRAAGLSINLGKSNFGKPHILYLGHVVGHAIVTRTSYALIVGAVLRVKGGRRQHRTGT